jgi:nicotinamidase-related amidase
VLDKCKGSAWWQTGLAEHVSSRAEVVVVGCMSDYCVRDTCRDAVERKNTVLLIHGAHGAYDRPAIFGAGIATPAHVVERQVEDALDTLGVIMMDMDDVPGIFDGR